MNVPCWVEQQGTGQVHGELAAGNAAEQAEEERRTTDAEAADEGQTQQQRRTQGRATKVGYSSLVCVLGILNPHCKGGGGTADCHHACKGMQGKSGLAAACSPN